MLKVQEQELNDTRFIDKILDNNDEEQSTSGNDYNNRVLNK